MSAQAEEWSQVQYDSDLGINTLNAHFITHSYPRHMHDYYVIGIVDCGPQVYQYRHEKHITPPNRMFVLNPAEAHTGEAATSGGFCYKALYPTEKHFKSAMHGLKNIAEDLPFFADPLIADPEMVKCFRALHKNLQGDASLLERESCMLLALRQLIVRQADAQPTQGKVKRERKAVHKIRAYLEDHYAHNVTLDDLSDYIGISSFHLLRVFRNEVGIPPHAYQESIRIRHAQRLLGAGQALADVAFETGFSSQSHFTSRFKRHIGVTPGQYARQVAV